jgi:hypothetical protein
MLGWQADVFIHVEHLDPRPGDVFLFDQGADEIQLGVARRNDDSRPASLCHCCLNHLGGLSGSVEPQCRA